MRTPKPRSAWQEWADQGAPSSTCPRRRDPMDVLGAVTTARCNELLPKMQTSLGDMLVKDALFAFGTRAGNPYLVAAEVLARRGPGADLRVLP